MERLHINAGNHVAQGDRLVFAGLRVALGVCRACHDRQITVTRTVDKLLAFNDMHAGLVGNKDTDNISAFLDNIDKIGVQIQGNTRTDRHFFQNNRKQNRVIVTGYTAHAHRTACQGKTVKLRHDIGVHRNAFHMRVHGRGDKCTGRGAAECAELLDQSNGCTFVCRRDCRNDTCSTAADNNNIIRREHVTGFL